MEIPPLLKKESNPITIYRIVIISDNLKKYVKDNRRFSYGKLNIENERSGKQKHRYPLRGGRGYRCYEKERVMKKVFSFYDIYYTR